MSNLTKLRCWRPQRTCFKHQLDLRLYSTAKTAQKKKPESVAETVVFGKFKIKDVQSTLPHMNFLKTNPVIPPFQKHQPTQNPSPLELFNHIEQFRMDPTGERWALISKTKYRKDQPSTTTQSDLQPQTTNVVDQENQTVKAPAVKKIQPGDIIAITKKLSSTSDKESLFVGCCLGIYRKGIASKIALRNNISGCEVDCTFPMFSPLITSIDIVKKAPPPVRKNVIAFNNLKGSTAPEAAQTFMTLPTSMFQTLKYRRSKLHNDRKYQSKSYQLRALKTPKERTKKTFEAPVTAA